MPQPNETVAFRWIEEVWNQRKLATVRELLPHDALYHASGNVLIGTEAFLREVYGPILNAIPDLSLRVEQVTEVGDQVLIHWTACGRHTGDGLGIPATMLSVAFTGMTRLRNRKGQIAEAHDQWNVAGLRNVLQLGPHSILPRESTAPRNRA